MQPVHPIFFLFWRHLKIKLRNRPKYIRRRDCTHHFKKFQPFGVRFLRNGGKPNVTYPTYVDLYPVSLCNIR
jgi:hypothetical protein